jgi:twitching motility protein PilU
MVARSGSDLFLTAEFPPAIKVDGKVTKVSPQPLTGQHTLQLARAVMNDKQAAEFERTKECNFAIAPQGVGRFRVNAFMQQGHVGLVFRTIPATLPTIESLNLPRVLKDVAMTKRGLVIFVGATGSGKSTSLAAMVDWRNETQPTATSSPSRTRWSSCTRTRTASSPSARSASTPTAGSRR